MLHDIKSERDIPPDDPRWKIRDALKMFVRDHFEDKFYIVEDLKWGYFTFVVRSNLQNEILTKEIDHKELQEKLNKYLEHEKLPQEKVKIDYMVNEDPKAPAGDQMIRFDILE